MMRKHGLGIFGSVAAMIAPALCVAAEGLPSPAVVQIGSAYVAKQYCSCLFVVGRSEASCRAEFKPQIDMAKVEVDRAGLPASAKVSVTLLTTTALATYDRRYGCVLEK